MSHVDEVITDVNRRRVMTRAHEDGFTIAWDYPGRTLLEVRILRSTDRSARTADEGLEQGQEMVYQDVTGSFRDSGLRPGQPYFYTVFARHPGGEWVRWGEYSVPGTGAAPSAAETAADLCDRAAGRSAPIDGTNDRRRPGGHGGGGKHALTSLAAVAAVILAMGLLPGAVSAADDDAGSGATTAALDAASTSAVAAAQADPSVAAVLDGTNPTVEEATPWGGDGDAPAGYRLRFRWSAAQAKSVNDVWPLLRSDAPAPEPPYDAALYRIRASDLSGLQVDVLMQGTSVIQVMPADGDTQFVLEEQTWPPLSLVPWFTSHPWVLAPVFVLLAVLLIVRAWLRSRAWNRRLPSMTRHDRQFIARVAVLLFLIAGFAWQFYEGWYAATGPSVDSGASAAGSLASLPLLLIPPALFVAGLILELTFASHRGSWALLAVLAGAASGYFLAAADNGATTNLNLTYYVLLAVLALVSIPRAFSAGKMGWSRSSSLRYS